MKKNIISGLILLMAVALCGIIFVQYFWIRNAIEVKEQQFDRTVKDALVEIVENFDKERNVFYVKEQIGDSAATSFITIDNDHNVNYSYSLSSDSLIWVDNAEDTESRPVSFSSISKSDLKTIDLSSDDETMISVITEGDENFTVRTIVKLDSLKKNLNQKQHIILSELRDSVEVIYMKKAMQIANENEELEGVINEMVIELKDLNFENATTVDRDLLESSIKKTLENRGVSQTYEYAVYNPEKDTAYITSSNGFVNDDKIDFKTRLFPQRIFQRPEMLFLSFPDKKVHLYKSVKWLMGGSLIFTLIIMLTFFITIRVILRQKKLSEIKSDFINNMTHEFKTPIATISLAADSIQNKAVIGEPERIKYFTNIIQEENRRMNSRVENILQMSLIDTNDFNFHFEEINAHAIIRQAAKNIELQLTHKNGRLEFQLEADNPIMQSDKIHFLNILTNLLDNAVKYSGREPVIKVTTNCRGNKLVLSVRDNGIGMSKDVHNKIFDKFFRVSKGDIHNVKGFGLGLSYVKAVVLAWGGSIDVKSEPGKGTEFIIELPVISIN